MIDHVRRGMAHSQSWMSRLLPGFSLALLVAMSGQFVAEHSNAPSMMMALLFGMVISFIYETDPKVRPGIEFSAGTILKFGIILLGTRISVDVVTALGWQAVFVVVFGLLATIAIGVLVGRALGLDKHFSILTAGAVSICGASAALAISSVLPKSEHSEKQLFITIVSVTALSTVAMILYPALLQQFEVGETLAGQIIGATIHDVAQVVGAGFSISEPAGTTATLVKLLRVSLLAPTIIVLALLMRRHLKATNPDSPHPPIVPAFVVGFFALATLNSFGFVPDGVKEASAFVARAALLTAIAAVGLKTNLRQLRSVGYAPIILLVVETVFIAIVGAAGFLILGR